MRPPEAYGAQTAHRSARENSDNLEHQASLTVGIANEKPEFLAKCAHRFDKWPVQFGIWSRERCQPSLLLITNEVTSRRDEIAEKDSFWRNESPHLLSRTRDRAAWSAWAHGLRRGPRRPSSHVLKPSRPSNGTLAMPRTVSLQRRCRRLRHLDRGDAPRNSALPSPLSGASRDNRDFTGAAACRMMA